MNTTATSSGVWLFPDSPSAAIVDAIVFAEHLGLDEIWLGDEGPGRDPFVLLAAAARATSTIRLGVAVTNPYLRHPVSIASTALTLQELSGGRFVLGVGAGGAMALDPAGIQRSRPRARVADAIRIIRAASERRPTPGYQPPPHSAPPADLPIVIGARGEQLNRLASELADGVFIGGIPNRVVPATARWARSRRPIAIILSVIAAFDALTLEAVRPQLVWTLSDAPHSTREALGIDEGQLAAAVSAMLAGDDRAARALIDDSVVDELVVHGTSEQIVARLEHLRAEHRPDSLVLNLHANGDPVAAVERAAAVLLPVTRGALSR